MHLVPFGERVPWEDDIPLIKKLLSRFEMGEGNFSPGKQIVLFDVPVGRSIKGATNGSKVRVGGVICFESIFSELVRQFVRRGAQLLVVVTNDGWFGRTGAPYQHAQMAVFRAIENRISVARSANTGVSMTIDPYGRVRKQTPIFKEAVFVDDIPIRAETTFFTRHGHVFTRSVVILTILMLVITRWTSKRPLRA
ncbi:MAG: apolipoprotein N-acyltransferase [candidate division KSB1 bacterium]|nr:apolipoprotein N-acyltransferase [candidate division KSB1 bacterium]